LDWALRANTFMPASPLVQAWLASIYSNVGDRANAARYAAALRSMAPDHTRLFLASMSVKSGDVARRKGQPIFDGLRLALGE